MAIIAATLFNLEFYQNKKTRLRRVFILRAAMPIHYEQLIFTFLQKSPQLAASANRFFIFYLLAVDAATRFKQFCL